MTMTSIGEPADRLLLNRTPIPAYALIAYGSTIRVPVLEPSSSRSR